MIFLENILKNFLPDLLLIQYTLLHPILQILTQSPSNEELRGVTLEDPVYLVPNNKVNQLRQHTHAYLKSISQIPTIYQTPRARSSQKRTQPYGENETLVATIDDLILETISKIRDLIATIEHQGKPISKLS